jgi:dienelactone hydrolase
MWQIAAAGMLAVLVACPAAGQNESTQVGRAQQNTQDSQTSGAGESSTPVVSPGVSVAPVGASQQWLKTSDGWTVCAWYWGPHTPNAPGVILAHMRGSDKSSFAGLAAKLADEGFAAIAIDLRGHGDTLSPDGRKVALNELQNADYLDMLNDIAAAHVFLASQPDVDGERVAVIGASIGANLGIIYAAGDRRVRTVVALSPGLDYFGLKPAEYLAGYGRRALYLIAGRGDKASFDSCVSIGQAAGQADPFSLRAFDGKAHGTNLLKEHEGLDMTIISGWLLNHLPPQR